MYAYIYTSGFMCVCDGRNLAYLRIIFAHWAARQQSNKLSCHKQYRCDYMRCQVNMVCMLLYITVCIGIKTFSWPVSIFISASGYICMYLYLYPEQDTKFLTLRRKYWSSLKNICIQMNDVTKLPDGPVDLCVYIVAN